MEIRKEIERIANSTEEEVGHKEENVKLKIIEKEAWGSNLQNSIKHKEVSSIKKLAHSLSHWEKIKTPWGQATVIRY